MLAVALVSRQGQSTVSLHDSAPLIKRDSIHHHDLGCFRFFWLGFFFFLSFFFFSSVCLCVVTQSSNGSLWGVQLFDWNIVHRIHSSSQNTRLLHSLLNVSKMFRLPSDMPALPSPVKNKKITLETTRFSGTTRSFAHFFWAPKFHFDRWEWWYRNWARRMQSNCNSNVGDLCCFNRPVGPNRRTQDTHSRVQRPLVRVCSVPFVSLLPLLYSPSKPTLPSQSGLILPPSLLFGKTVQRKNRKTTRVPNRKETATPPSGYKEIVRFPYLVQKFI